MKRCFVCLCEKPITEFYTHRAMADGHLNKCMDCTKAYEKERRKRIPEQLKAYEQKRANLPHRKELAKRIQEKWRAEFRERRAANVELGNAVRSGLVKRQPCWVCGARAQGHHPDYSRPLDVVWLCDPHHKQAHALVREA